MTLVEHFLNTHYKHISLLVDNVEYGNKYSFLSIETEQPRDNDQKYLFITIKQCFGDLSSLVLDFEETRKMISELSICMNAIKTYAKQNKFKIELRSSIV